MCYVLCAMCYVHLPTGTYTCILCMHVHVPWDIVYFTSQNHIVITMHCISHSLHSIYLPFTHIITCISLCTWGITHSYLYQLLDEVCRKWTVIDCSDALEKYNVKKNRYPNRVPCEYSNNIKMLNLKFSFFIDNVSRARLRPSEVLGSDYINASFVDVRNNTHMYIQCTECLYYYM